MSVGPGNVLVAVCIIACVVGALVTISARNPIRGAVGLLGTILGIAGLFLQLHAEFLAAIQVIVYAGAVVVLFVFVIMVLGPDARASAGNRPAKAKVSRALAGGLLALMALATGILTLGSAGEPTRFASARPEHGSVEAVGTLLFTRGVVPFELATALLLAAIIGAIAVARSKQVAHETPPVDDATRRMYGGPVHPRDGRTHAASVPPAPVKGHGHGHPVASRGPGSARSGQ